MEVLVYEAASAGNLSNNGMVPSNILCEGYGMLRTFTQDLKQAGHRVTTVLDERLLRFSPPIETDQTIPSNSQTKPETLLRRLVPGFDGVYIIAPESAGLLERLVEAVINGAGGGASLNASLEAIGVVADKAQVYRVLNNAGFKVPETVFIDFKDYRGQIARIRSLGFPVILKPVSGVGASGLSVVRGESDVKAAVRKLKKEATSSYFLAQRFVRGVPASTSLLVSRREGVPISLNRQILSLSSPNRSSSYLGGATPLRHRLQGKALRVARGAVQLFRGLRGYVCVDMVLEGDEPVIIEINPRLSTSYVGLRRVFGFNIAQSILDAILRDRLPEGVEGLGYSLFLKVAYLKGFTGNALARTYGQEDVVAPPFPVKGSEKAYALIATYATTLRGAGKRFSRVKGQLAKLLVRGY